MHRGFHAEVKRFIVFTLVCGAFGLLIGYPRWALIMGGAIYMSWLFWQIRQLSIWLQDTNRQVPPDIGGFWGDIIDHIIRLQKRQDREKARMKAVLKRGQETTAALRDGVVLIDSHGNIDWFNQSAQALLGFQSSDLGNPIVNFIRHPSFIHYFDEGNYSDPLDLPSPLGDKRLQYQLTRFGQGERLLVLRDFTRIYRLEQMRKDFVANVSHELRTPLTVIRGYVETMAMSPNLSPMWEKALHQMEEQGQRMTALINDLITLSQLETSNIEREQRPVPVLPMLNIIRADSLALAGSKTPTINIECDDKLTLVGSSKELHSALSNLVYNAVKYCPENATINIEANVDRDMVRIAVKDNGPGIDPIHLPRLTERFYRVDSSRTSSSGGTGLGLAIVKHILIRHNAKLEIESTPNRGSCFTCVFPLTRLA